MSHYTQPLSDPSRLLATQHSVDASVDPAFDSYLEEIERQFAEYRLTNRGGKGVINLKTTERVGKVVGIAQVDETSEVMLISHYGKIIRMDSTTIRESGRNAQGVRLLHLEPGDRVAAAVVIAPEEEGNGGNGGTLIQ